MNGSLVRYKNGCNGDMLNRDRIVYFSINFPLLSLSSLKQRDENCGSRFRFVAIHAFDRRTDRRIDIQTERRQQYRAYTFAVELTQAA